jgi:hypothetical protein
MSEWNVDFDKLAKQKLENGEMVATGSDMELIAEFTMEKVPNFDNTDFIEVPHLRLQAPGDKNKVYHQPAILESAPGRPSDPERFPQEWAAFEAGRSGNAGTSLYDWPELSAADARRLDLAGVKTVEQLAHVSDNNLQGLGMGALALRDSARRHLTGNGVEQQLREQISAQSDQISKLTDIVNKLLEKSGAEPEPTAKAGASDETKAPSRGRRAPVSA